MQFAILVDRPYCDLGDKEPLVIRAMFDFNFARGDVASRGVFAALLKKQLAVHSTVSSLIVTQ